METRCEISYRIFYENGHTKEGLVQETSTFNLDSRLSEIIEKVQNRGRVLGELAGWRYKGVKILEINTTGDHL